MLVPCRMLFALTLAYSPLMLVAAEIAPLESPNRCMSLTFRLNEQGRPGFELLYRGNPIASGSLGLEFAGSAPVRDHLKIVSERRQSHDETYSIPVGKTSSARDHHNELIVSLEDAGGGRVLTP